MSISKKEVWRFGLNIGMYGTIHSSAWKKKWEIVNDFIMNIIG